MKGGGSFGSRWGCKLARGGGGGLSWGGGRGCRWGRGVS